MKMSRRAYNPLFAKTNQNNHPPTHTQTAYPNQPNLNSQIPHSALRNPHSRKPILSTLTPDQISTLIEACEEMNHSYQDVSQFARETMNLQISPSTLCRLYTRHQIAEDQQTTQEYLDASGPSDDSAIRDPQSAILELAQNQLHLRLLELSSRPNPDASDLAPSSKSSPASRR